MEVKYKTVVGESGCSDQHSPLKEQSEFCCGRMIDAFDGGVIAFAHDDYGVSKPEVQIVRQFYRYGDLDPSTHAIDFCPFCGAKINATEAQRVRRVREEKTETITQTKVSYREEPA